MSQHVLGGKWSRSSSTKYTTISATWKSLCNTGNKRLLKYFGLELAEYGVFFFYLHGIKRTARKINSNGNIILWRAVLMFNTNWLHLEVLRLEWVVYLLITYSYFQNNLKIKTLFFVCTSMILFILFIIAIHRDSNFSTRFHPVLPKFFRWSRWCLLLRWNPKATCESTLLGTGR